MFFLAVGRKGAKLKMARKPRDFAIGYLDPVKDESGAQVVHPEKGLKWKVRVELPRRGSKRERQRKNRIVYKLYVAS